MRYVSIAGNAPSVDLTTAVLAGLAPDGGLYVPERLPPLSEGLVSPAADATLAATARAVLAPFGSGLGDGELAEVVAAALDFETPLVPLGDGVHLLELFHGPTLAFKDVGARFLARLLPRIGGGGERPLTVLVATSGDTGGAVAAAFHRVEGTEVVVLYPRGRVSALQEKQLATLGDNVRAFAVEGGFDDCQRLAKAAFADPVLSRRLRLTSANSINVGRLLPQVAYYVHAARQLPPGAPPPLFAVPCGNLGNLTAGLYAHRAGLPAAGFVAATNANRVFVDYLESGRCEPQPSERTLSNAMDVGAPSNLARIRSLYGDDLTALRRDVSGSAHDDDATRQAILEVRSRCGTLLDPHTAVGYLALRKRLAEIERPATGVLLATAHPAKFRDELEPLLGEAIPLPERLARRLDRPTVAVPIAASLDALRDELVVRS